MKRASIGVLVIWVIVFLGVIRVSAQGDPTPRPVTDDDVNRVALTLYCPVCQNVPLAVCETQACEQWREEIRALLGQGYTDDQIRQRFVQEYGQKTLGLPMPGIAYDLTVYLPYLVIALFGVIIGISLLMWRRRVRVQPVNETAAPNADEYHQRLEDEIRRLD